MERTHKVEYITTVERIGIAKGKAEGRAEGEQICIQKGQKGQLTRKCSAIRFLQCRQQFPDRDPGGAPRCRGHRGNGWLAES